MPDDSARLILEDDQPGLVQVWFKTRLTEVETILVRAEQTAFGGLPDNLTPSDIVSRLEAYWRDAAYIETLASRQFKARSRHWPSSESDTRVLTLQNTAKHAVEDMGATVMKIANLVREARETVKVAAAEINK